MRILKNTVLVLGLQALVMLTSAGCSFFGNSSSEPRPYELAPGYTGIFSTRPEPGTHGFYLVKLKTPPLLTVTTKPTADEIKNLTAEQDLVLKSLTELSTDIKVIYRYRLVLNGFAIVAPVALEEKIGAIGGVSHLESAGLFSRPAIEITNKSILASAIQERNSVKFIGGEAAHARGVRGQGMRIGIIDSGIDYTHAMFGGVGTEQAYKDIRPGETTTLFPSAKVVGGLDFVGTEYDSGSPDFNKRLPMIDPNPLDEGGHGTHVAGTVAGHGDGVLTYDGVAPDASLYALKVFGADGSTNDSVVVAAMEYAADPNSDGDTSDRLDVVNLSLGSGYGDGHILYTEAIQNLSRSGTVVVCSGGNSGDTPYIVGSPGVADDAISVAASVDDMDQNWKFRAAKFTTVDDPEIYTEAIEGAITKPLSEIQSLVGELFYVGLADQDFSPETAAALAGHIALIDRGGVSFADKIRRSEAAGAIAVVVVNSQDDAPFVMGGGDGEKFGIPGVMISKVLGIKLKAALGKGAVLGDLTTTKKIEKPELIDTITSFSSRGPRSIDALLKPEISAPGAKIVSAKMGGGAAGTEMSGTSMAAPHMTGVMALLKQQNPGLTSAELKSLVMSTAKSLIDAEKKPYSLSRQGAGRVQLEKALAQTLVTEPSAISLGVMGLEGKKSMQRELNIKNKASHPVSIRFELREATAGLRLAPLKGLELQANSEQRVALRFEIEEFGEVGGLVVLTDVNGIEIARVPVLSVVHSVSRISAEELAVRSTSSLDSQGAVVDLKLKNKSRHDGLAIPFNFIARDGRKANPTLDQFQTTICDLAETGYRVVDKAGVPTLQIAAKLFEPMTTWDLCEISVLIDADGDKLADQELIGAKQDHLEGLTAKTYASILLDVSEAKRLRKEYDTAVMTPRKPEEKAPVLDFKPAIVDLQPMQAFEQSSIAIVEVPLASVRLRSNSGLSVRIATSAQTGSAIESDDFFSTNPKHWALLNVKDAGAPFVGLPESIALKAGESKTVSFVKGAEQGRLLMLYPDGRSMFGGLGKDGQVEVLAPVYRP